MNPRNEIVPQAVPGQSHGLPAFEDSAESKIYRFTYGGDARPLKPYLLGRYAYGRDHRWRQSFYPHRVRLNGREVDEHSRVAPGDKLAYLHLRREEPPPPRLAAPLYEDAWLLALHKPDCIPVNPSGVYYFTCMALLAREKLGLPELTPAHRLDLETGGPLLFAKRKDDVKEIHRLFHGKSIRKTYRALVHGAFPAGMGQICGKIIPLAGSAISTKLTLEPGGGAEHSLTRIHEARPRPLPSFRNDTGKHSGKLSKERFTELTLEPVTGKTNQLRVHLAAVGHPIVGDKKYFPDEGLFLDWLEHRDFERLRDRLLLPRQALQCESLEFAHPFTGAPVHIRALPGSWREKLGGLPAANS